MLYALMLISVSLTANVSAVFAANYCNPAYADESMRRNRGLIRVATFNVSLSRNAAGELLTDMKSGNDPQIKTIAEIIQTVHPVILLLNEFDYDSDVKAAKGFISDYLGKSQNGKLPIQYPHVFSAPSYTGI